MLIMTCNKRSRSPKNSGISDFTSLYNSSLLSYLRADVDEIARLIISSMEDCRICKFTLPASILTISKTSLIGNVSRSPSAVIILMFY